MHVFLDYFLFFYKKLISLILLVTSIHPDLQIQIIIIILNYSNPSYSHPIYPRDLYILSLGCLCNPFCHHRAQAASISGFSYGNALLNGYQLSTTPTSSLPHRGSQREPLKLQIKSHPLLPPAKTSSISIKSN